MVLTPGSLREVGFGPRQPLFKVVEGDSVDRTRAISPESAWPRGKPPTDGSDVRASGPDDLQMVKQGVPGQASDIFSTW